MLKIFNLRCLLRSYGGSVARSTGCNYSTSKKGKKGTNKTTSKDDTPIEPLQLSYNSYEDLSSDLTTSAAPVIIMHGRQPVFETKNPFNN